LTKFLILKKDPEEYKDQIIRFWNDYLPGTCAGRFYWMKNGNPAGPAIWFFAFPKDNNELAGTISIIPKEMIVNHKIIRAGILGDFMVNAKYRVFGPALQLVKTAMRCLPQLDLDFMYSIPNPKSEKNIKRCGFKNIGRIYYLGKPLKLSHYLENYLSHYSAKAFGVFLDQMIKILTKETYISSRGFFEEVTVIDESFDVLCEEIRSTQSGIFGNHNRDYLSWRYLQNPYYAFRILTYRETCNSDLLGYIIFVIEGEKCEIFDILFKNNTILNRLLKKIIGTARKSGSKTIYISLFPNNPCLKLLRRYFFLDTKYEMKLYFFGERENLDRECMLFSGDRNI